MDIFITAVLTIFILGVLVFVHELGHFIAAIKARVHVDEFAFGFGPSLFSKEWKGVIYKINAIPLGGYVKMLGDMDGSSFRRYPSKDTKSEDRDFVTKILKPKGLDKQDSDYREVVDYIKSQESKLSKKEYQILENYVANDFIPNHPKNFDNKGFLPRLTVLLAGVFMNFVLGSILFYILFLLTGFTIDISKIGEPTFWGAKTSNPPVLFQVYREEYKPYEGSLIISYDGERELGQEKLDSLLVKNYNREAPIVLQSANGYINTEIILSGEGINTNFDEEVRDKVILIDVTKDSAADKAGLKSGDIILSIANTELRDPDHLRELLKAYRGSNVEIVYIDTKGEIKSVIADLPDVEDKKPVLGAIPVSNSSYYESALRLDYSENKLASGVLHSVNLIFYNIDAMGEFISEALAEKSVEPVFSKVNSIVAVVDVTFSFVKTDNFLSLLNLVAMLSVILAFMNILPIPLFDGGHVLFLFVEKIRRKKISTKVQNRIGQVVFYLLILFTIAIVFKDILQFDWPQRIGNTVLDIIK